MTQDNTQRDKAVRQLVSDVYGEQYAENVSRNEWALLDIANSLRRIALALEKRK